MTGAPPYPRATYRLQMSKAFRFEDARRIVPYLAALGISHVYLSPISMARPGSTHGYDIVDHNRLNPEIGDERELADFVTTLHEHAMGLIIDFVPNHMFVGPDNSWWMDILEWGRSSPFASYVDIDWAPLEPTNAGKVVLPFLGDHYGNVLERGELKPCFDETRGIFAVHYFDHLFPLSPRDYPALLRRAAADSPEAARELNPVILDLQDCLRLRRGRVRRLARGERVAAMKGKLADIAKASRAVGLALVEAAAALDGEPGKPVSFDPLHRLLERQSYRLAFWRVAAHEINYRRFFDINELAGLRMEQPELFERSHRLIERLIAEGKIEGIRLDHVDGLRDPRAYLTRLQRLAQERRQRPEGKRSSRKPLYTVVEKILAPEERVPADWPVNGTTGYDFMREVTGLFIDPLGQSVITRTYERFIGRRTDYAETVANAKRAIMRQTMASELNVLANAFNRIAKRNRHSRDFTMTGFREALEDVIACFPVYRTYVTAKGATPEDRRIISVATAAASKVAHAADATIYDFIRDVLTIDLLSTRRGGALRRDVTDAALKFQQYTGPVMAKAVEDTAFYRYVRFLSLNEVGSAPDRFGVAPAAFHAAAKERLASQPLSMIATATHDHKRGEDVRARLNVLSEIPRRWAACVTRWARLNARWTRISNGIGPSRDDEYFFYQTLVGAWPLEITSPDFHGIDEFKERVRAYLVKAAREAKTHTSWTAPDESYEDALARFTEAVLGPDQNRLFLEDVVEFVNRIAPAGAVNGLAQMVLKLTVPGVPDFYQGSEEWDLSLVDPDNRRPVDFEILRARLAELEAAPSAAQADWRNGALKHGVANRLLGLRRAFPALFAAGSYRVLEVNGPRAQNVVAFVRSLKGKALVVLVQRLTSSEIMETGMLQACKWGLSSVILNHEFHRAKLRNVLSGRNVETSPDGSLRLADAFAELPVCVLYSGA